MQPEPDQIEPPPSPEPRAARHAFPETRWSVVARSQRDDPEAQKALASLCADYWYPLYAFARREGLSSQDAEDLTQEFFHAVIAKGTFGEADSRRGRLRTFLLAAFKHFTLNQQRRERAAKRGGGQPALSLDAAWAEARFRAEPADRETPETLYDRVWAERILERALAGLRETYESAGSGAHYAVLRQFLGWNEGALSYSEAGAALGLTENAVKVAVHRLRRRYREHLRRTVADTLPNASSAEIDEEIRHLLAALA